MTSLTSFTQKDLSRLHRQASDSHKGQNGRLLVIGGSQLFHASIFWAADIASRFVDLVHFSSPTEENNELVRFKLKQGFWDGIVVDWQHIEAYIEEDDVILIGPGMPREEGLMEGELPTSEIVNSLLRRHASKKWVIDGGALQEVDPELLNSNMIITPHLKEWQRLLKNMGEADAEAPIKLTLEEMAERVSHISRKLKGVHILLKGYAQQDFACNGETCFVVTGGNEGLTKGGTGDILAGLVASLYCFNPPELAAAGASQVLKLTADELYQSVGPFYNSSDLVNKIPEVMYILQRH